MLSERANFASRKENNEAFTWHGAKHLGLMLFVFVRGSEVSHWFVLCSISCPTTFCDALIALGICIAHLHLCVLFLASYAFKVHSNKC